jgi:hypothetical protein
MSWTDNTLQAAIEAQAGPGVMMVVASGNSGSSCSTVVAFRSTDNGATWLARSTALPGGQSEDKEWIPMDNFPGPGQGNL